MNRNALGFEIIADHAVSSRTAPGLQIGDGLQCLMLFSVVDNGAQVSPSFGVCLKFRAGSLKCIKIGFGAVVFFPEVLRKHRLRKCLFRSKLWNKTVAKTTCFSL